MLVAHTDVEIRRLVRDVLEDTGRPTIEAADADGALALCRRERPQVAFVEAGLRTADGLDLLDAVKRDIDLFRVALVLTARDLDPAAVPAALRRGAQDVLREPIDPVELIARVQAAERTKILQEELDTQSRRLESLIYGDELTGLVNRRFLLNQLGALVSGARRHDRPLSVVMLDIDHFKAVNDTYGHAAGDAVLVGVATTMRDRLRAEDWIGRLGGEEFLAILPDDDADGATVVAENLREAVETMGVRHEGEMLRVTASVGWSSLEGDEGAEELLRRADGALYAAKRAGRNTTRGAATLRRRV